MALTLVSVSSLIFDKILWAASASFVGPDVVGDVEAVFGHITALSMLSVGV